MRLTKAQIEVLKYLSQNKNAYLEVDTSEGNAREYFQIKSNDRIGLMSRKTFEALIKPERDLTYCKNGKWMISEKGKQYLKELKNGTREYKL